MGVACLGKWRVWLIGLALLIYIVLVYWLVFFGEIGLNLSYLSNWEEAKTILWRQLVVGLTEEILFRGIILYALVRVWGGTRRGLYAGVVLSAVLFSISHILQGLAGQPLNIALFVLLEALISGFWYALYVLLTESLWPVVLIHAFSNMSVAMKALTEPGWTLSVSGLVGVILLQFPLVILGMWLLQRRGGRLTVPYIP
jgi:membrane protease YdiL (CAAX protease family)